MSALSISIVRRLGDFDLTAEIEAPAGITALFGRSGSGKTSIVNAVAGLLRPDSGHIAIGGRRLFDSAAGVDLPVHKRRVGYVFQDARLFPHLSVGRNLNYGGTHDADRIIAMLGLSPMLDRAPSTLSGGERQRVALGRALMCNPDILLMDEPLAALDAARKAEIMPYLERLRDETRLPVLYVSHDISEVARLATTLALIDRGRVVRVGPLAEVLGDPAHGGHFDLRDLGAVVLGEVSAYDPADDLSDVRFSGGRLVLPGRVGAPGTKARVRIAAHDVILARNPPVGLSALNVVAARVTAIVEGDGPGVVVSLLAGDAPLLARITRRSVRALELTVGQEVHAILKTVSVAPVDMGS